jgi:hypothetical protein
MERSPGSRTIRRVKIACVGWVAGVVLQLLAQRSGLPIFIEVCGWAMLVYGVVVVVWLGSSTHSSPARPVADALRFEASCPEFLRARMSEPKGTQRTEADVGLARPFHRITIELQGTPHSDRAQIVSQLEGVLARLRAGEVAGEHHEQGFGYRFKTTSPPGTTS